MKPNPESDWEKLLRRARADSPPAPNLAELHRVVRDAAITKNLTPAGWTQEFAVRFGTPRATIACFALAVACALMTSWTVTDVRESMSWAELISTTTGGVP